MFFTFYCCQSIEQFLQFKYIDGSYMLKRFVRRFCLSFSHDNQSGKSGHLSSPKTH